MSTGNEETNGNGTNETGTPTRDVQTPAVMPTSTTNVTTRKLAATLQGVYTKIDNIKADKVTGDGHNGHLADLDSTGNLHDSGYTPASFATAEQGDKADRAVQSVKMVSNDNAELKNGTSVIIPLAVPTGTGATPGLLSAEDKSKLNSIASGAEVNQNAFSKIKVGSTDIEADSKTDTLELVAGTYITLTPDATSDKVTIGSNLASKEAAENGTAVSLVTTGEKYTWNAKQDALAFEGTYDATSNKVATQSTVSNAINALDVTEVGGDGKYIKKIKEENGKITATVETMDTTPTANSQKAVTSGGIKSALDLKAPLASPALTGTPTAPTPATGNDSTQIATTAFVNAEIESKMAAADAMRYMGTVAGGSTGAYGALTPAASKGDTYKVSTAGKIDGIVVEVGDMLICNTDNTTAATESDYASIAGKWDFIQTNIDGAVTGPASSTAAKVAGFADTTGKKIRELTAAEIKAAAGLSNVANTNITVSATDGVTDNTNNVTYKYTHPPYDSATAAAVKVGRDSTGHVVIGNALTKSDVGLGNVVNTGDSATPVSGGTTKFTTGGAYTELNKKVDKVDGKGLSTNDYTNDEKTKLAGIEEGAEVNQNAFSNIKVGTGNTAVTISADSKTDTLNVIGGTHLTVSVPANTDQLQISTDLSSKAAASGGTTESLVTTGEKYTWNSKAAGSHTHGNIQNGGTLQTDDVTIATGDQLVITDSSNGKKVARASTTFDGSTTTTALTPKGTWESFAKAADITTAVNGLNATVTSSDGTNVQVKVTEAKGKITAVNITTDKTEDKNNKVTSWSSTPNNTHYPSEKLVKDSLDGKASSTHAHGNITNAGKITATGVAIENTDTLVIVDKTDDLVKQTSIAFDGTTTNKALTPAGSWEPFAKAADITSAVNALDATVTSTDGTNVQVKVTEADGKITAVNVTTDKTEDKNNKVTSWSTTTTNTHYPSEKLVKDSLDGKADKVSNATAGNFAALDANGNLTDSGKKASDFSDFHHGHGYIDENGMIQSTGTNSGQAAISNNCNIVYADNTGKIKKSTVAFDATSDYKALTQKGTFETMVKNVKLDGASSNLTNTNGTVTIPNAVATGASGATNGLMTTADKLKLDNLDNAYLGHAYGTCSDYVDDGGIRKYKIVSPSYQYMHGGIIAVYFTDVEMISAAQGGAAFAVVDRADSAVGLYKLVRYRHGAKGAWPAGVVNGGDIGYFIYNYTDDVFEFLGTDRTGVNISYDSTNHKITQTIDGVTTDVVSVTTLKTDAGLDNVDNTRDADKEVLSATKLKTARNLEGISFDGTKNIHRYGTCFTAAATVAKAVTLSDSMTFTLATGASVFVNFTNSNTASAPTLNVNGTGAKLIKRYGTTAPGTRAATSWQAGSVVHLVYDGTNWQMVGWLNNDTTYSNASLGQGYGTCSIAEATAAKEVTLSGYELATGGIVAVKFTYGLCANATLNINSKGAKNIFINGAAVTDTTCKNVLAGDIAYFIYDGTQYQFLGTDRTRASVDYDSTNKKITKTIDGVTTDVVTIADIKSDLAIKNAEYGQGYGTCATAAATTTKAVTLSNYVKTEGGIVAVKFDYAVPAGALLNINSKGADPIYYSGAAITGEIIQAGDIATFIYSSSKYILLSVDRSAGEMTDQEVQDLIDALL